MYQQLFSILALSTLCVSAVPASVAERDTPLSFITEYSDGSCDNVVYRVDTGGSGTYNCFPVCADTGPISVTGSGCATVTWSTTDCQGSSYLIHNSDCHSLPYGSVSVQC